MLDVVHLFSSSYSSEAFPFWSQAARLSICDVSRRLWAPNNDLAANNPDEDDDFCLDFVEHVCLEGDALEDCCLVGCGAFGEISDCETRGCGDEYGALGDPELEVLEDDEALQETVCEYLYDW